MSLPAHKHNIEEIAVHKETFQINGHQFTCQESYYEGELLNGVDLRIKEMRGLSPDPRLIDYLRESQELVFAISSTMLLYNTHKKAYTHLLNVEGEVVLLKTRVDKTNNRQYILWVQKQMVEKEQQQFLLKKYGKTVNNAYKESRLKKKVAINKSNQQSEDKDVMKNMFSGYVEETQFLEERNDNRPSRNRKVTFENDYLYTLKVYDYSKKEYLFEGQIKIEREIISDLFLFCNEVKAVGYILDDQQMEEQWIYYTQLAKKDSRRKQSDSNAKFKCLLASQKIQNTIYNTQQSCYLFYQDKTFYRFSAFEHPEDESVYIQNYLQLTSKGENNAKPIRINVKRQAEFEQPILDLALNDQYLAILTSRCIYFHSAFDTQSLIFMHQLEDPKAPLGIQFNKYVLMLSYKNSSTISTFQVRNKSLKIINSTTLELINCQEINKMYCNTMTSEVFCVVRFYEPVSRAREKLQQQGKESTIQYGIKPAYIDITASYLSPASKTEAKLLSIGKQRFKKLHSCPWLTNYLIETQDSIYFNGWKESFDNKRCLELHPTGIFLVVCFKEAFKIYMITFEGIINTYRGDSINDIQNCAISPRGNHLAISTNTLVIIYDFYSCSKLKTFSLPLGVCIENMEYREDYLCCYLKSKKLYVYDSNNNYKECLVFNPKAYVSDITKEQELSQMAVNLTYQLFNYVSVHAVFYDPQLHIIIYSAKGGVYFFNCESNEMLISVESDPITCFYYCHNLKTLFMGTQNGEIMGFPWPNKPSNLMSEHKKYKVHGSSIVSMLVSSDLKQLVTLAEDNSLCVSYLTYVKNLKRLEGLELIEYLGGSIQINFDVLLRKGFYQYTHSELNNKLDLMKDFEEEAMNTTFMMPEERLKQKEQMLSNVKEETFKLTEINNKEYEGFSEITNTAKDQVNDLKEAFEEFQRAAKIQKKELEQQYFQQYLQQYNASEKAKERLALLTANYASIKKQQKEACQQALMIEQTRQQQQLQMLQSDYQRQKQNWWKQRPQELVAIDQQKQQFIEQNINILEDVMAGYNMNNGGLSCKNNNLQKQIMKLKKKLEEHNFLLYRLQNNTNVLLREKSNYSQLKEEKEKVLEKEDKVNLVEIQKRYVKQTKQLIEKDKEINVKITVHEKQQNTIIYLQRCLEALESNIENVVESLLQEKLQTKELIDKRQSLQTATKQTHARVVNSKKDVQILRNAFNNFRYTLNNVADQLISNRKGDPLALLRKQEIIDPLQASKELKEIKEEIIQQKDEGEIDEIKECFALNKPHILNKTSENWMKDYRKLKTEGSPCNRASYNNETSVRLRTSEKPKSIGLKQASSVLGQAWTARMQVEKNNRKVIFRQRQEQKYYERIQTEQVVYQNGTKKINKENQDLIESYNSLAMESKKIADSLKKQKLMSNLSLRKDNSKHKELNPTPFQNYLKNKSKKQKSTQIIVPAHIYQC